MPEVITLEGSPAELLGGPRPKNDDTGSERAQEQDDEDAASTVTIHEVPRQLS